MEGSGMKMISVKRMSPAVMSRVRNGHKIRLMKGEGTQLVVLPEQYTQIEKAFLKNKGIQVALSPPEIDANRVVEGGAGIFGKRFDNALKKVGVKKAVYSAASAVKPLAMDLIDQGAVAATMYAPQLAPVIGLASSAAKQYIDNPSSLQSKKGLRALGNEAIDVGLQAAAPMAAQYGVDLSELKALMKEAKAAKGATKTVRARGEDAMLGELQRMVDARRSRSTSAPVSTDLYSQFDTDGIIGNGMKRCKECPMCSGKGLYAGAASGRGMPGMAPMRKASGKFVNLSRKLMGGELQALESQAADANFAFRYTLPPSYQR
jgi:hypothetical protein